MAEGTREEQPEAVVAAYVQPVPVGDLAGPALEAVDPDLVLLGIDRRKVVRPHVRAESDDDVLRHFARGLRCRLEVGEGVDLHAGVFGRQRARAVVQEQKPLRAHERRVRPLQGPAVRQAQRLRAVLALAPVHRVVEPDVQPRRTRRLPLVHVAQHAFAVYGRKVRIREAEHVAVVAAFAGDEAVQVRALARRRHEVAGVVPAAREKPLVAPLAGLGRRAVVRVPVASPWVYALVPEPAHLHRRLLQHVRAPHEGKLPGTLGVDRSDLLVGSREDDVGVVLDKCINAVQRALLGAAVHREVASEPVDGESVRAAQGLEVAVHGLDDRRRQAAVLLRMHPLPPHRLVVREEARLADEHRGHVGPVVRGREYRQLHTGDHLDERDELRHRRAGDVGREVVRIPRPLLPDNLRGGLSVLDERERLVEPVAFLRVEVLRPVGIVWLERLAEALPLRALSVPAARICARRRRNHHRGNQLPHGHIFHSPFAVLK